MSIAKENKTKTSIVPAKAIKEKSTFNLSLDTLEALDDAWMQLRKELRGGAKVTKTRILEKAIAIVLDDLASKGESSQLYKKLKEQS